MENGEKKIRQELLTEYAAAHAAYLHYDSFTWQVGAVLGAGLFVFLGFLASDDSQVRVFLASAVIVPVLMSTWILYADHNRQIYLQKLDRIHDLEKLFAFKQHLGWKRPEAIYRCFGLSGHQLNLLFYIAGSFSPATLAWAVHHIACPFLLTLVVCIIVLLFMLINYIRLKKWKRNLATTDRGTVLSINSEVQKVSYQPGKIEYNTYDDAATEVSRITSKPRTVTVNDKNIDERENLEAEGWTWKPLKKGGILRIRHTHGNEIVVRL